MPYYITDSSPDCNGWATVKADGEVMGCHSTKQDAIDQALAIAQNEGSTYEGELRAAPDELSEGDFVRWNSSGGTARGRIEYIMREGTLGVPDSDFSIEATEDDPAALIRVYREDDEGYWEETETLVGHKFSTLTKIEPLPQDEDNEEEETRAVDLTPPAYMRAAARRGLEYYEDGKGGDGLVTATITDARKMANGEALSEDKWRRIGPWIARHIGDLDAPAAKPDSPDYPSAGVVAMLLWGAPANRRGAERTQAYAEGVVARLEAEEERKKTMSNRETRAFESDFEIRESDSGMTFVGYAAKFNSRSENLGGFTETIEPGAFSRSLKSRNDVKLLVNHDTGRVLASSRARTMRLVEDNIGLRVEADLPNTTDGRDMAELLKRGDLSSMSFGFNVIKDSWNAEGDQRTLKSVRLFEVSIVAFPAYQSTEASVRGLDKVAQRTSVDPDALADVMLKIEEGSDLTGEQAELMKSVVDKLAPRSEEPAQAEPNLLSLKQKQLDLLLKRI